MASCLPVSFLLNQVMIFMAMVFLHYRDVAGIIPRCACRLKHSNGWSQPVGTGNIPCVKVNGLPGGGENIYLHRYGFVLLLIRCYSSHVNADGRARKNALSGIRERGLDNDAEAS
jgi:hypothetical protein